VMARGAFRSYDVLPCDADLSSTRLLRPYISVCFKAYVPRAYVDTCTRECVQFSSVNTCCAGKVRLCMYNGTMCLQIFSTKVTSSGETWN
jgi:hypothetical protein